MVIYIVNFVVGDSVVDGFGVFVVNLVVNVESSVEDFFNVVFEGFGEGFEFYCFCNFDNFIEGDGFVVFDVFFFFVVMGGFFEGVDDEGRGGRDDGNGGLMVLDGEFDGYLEIFLYL